MSTSLNLGIILKRSNRTLRRNESEKDAVATLTHIHMANLKLTKLVDLHLFSMASVLYCYDNELESLDGIENLPRLDELQAQNNRITLIPTLNPFQLFKLDLRNNKISVIQGFERQANLEELYLSRQDVSEVTFAPHCFETIAVTLVVLEMADCGILDLSELLCCHNIRVLNLSGNKIDKLEQVKELCHNMPYLESLDLRNNPVCSIVKYREQVILMGNFRELDGKDIPETQREGLIRLQNRKIGKPKKPKPQKEPSDLVIRHLG